MNEKRRYQVKHQIVSKFSKLCLENEFYEKLRPLKNQEILVKNIFNIIETYTTGSNLCLQVSKILESKSEKYPTGKFVVWEFERHKIRERSILKDCPTGFTFPAPYILPDNIEDFPVSLLVRMIGMTGNAAYFGFLKICQPQYGDTVVISDAHKAIGCHVCQIAKMLDCRVIGITNSDENGKWLVEKIGFDYFINYEKLKTSKKLAKYAPEGIDCYFDMVGGQISCAVIKQMNSIGRICTYGYIEGYTCIISNTPIAELTENAPLCREVRIQGFQLENWRFRWNESMDINFKWLHENKLKHIKEVSSKHELLFKEFLEILNQNLMVSYRTYNSF